MKKALISRYGAYGDIIHCSHLPHLLKEKGYDQVDFETNYKGIQLLSKNPYIDNIIYFNPHDYLHTFGHPTMRERHWKNVSQGYDKFVNLYNSLEYNCIAMEDSVEYYMHPSARKWMREVNFYDEMTRFAGYPEEVGNWTGELYYSAEEDQIARDSIKKYEGKYIVLINLTGTTIHKRFVRSPEVINWILTNIPNAHIITTGDKSCKSIDFKGNQISSVVGRFPFRQVALLAKYVDLVITMESGLGVAANSWDTPTIQLMTSSSIDNHPKYAKNDYSLQSPAKCSPCSKGPYRFIGCPHEDGFPKCVYFNVDDITRQVKRAYEDRNNERLAERDKISVSDVATVSTMRDGSLSFG